jgi:hypothetical protein
VITGSLGLALAIFLFVFMNGLVLSGKVSPAAAEIISRLWIVGVIPMFVGIALVINGVFVSKRLAQIARDAARRPSNLPESDINPITNGTAETTKFIPPGFSVTENTTNISEVPTITKIVEWLGAFP